MKTKRQQAKAAADKVARERRKKNVRASEVQKKAKENKARKEARILLKKQAKAKPKTQSWVKRLLSRQVTALPEGKLTKEQVHEEFIKIAEKRSTLSRRDRTRIEHAHEQSIKKIMGLDRKKEEVR
jgi:hypothetical protein